MALFETKTPEQKEARRALREAERASAQVRRDAERAERAEWERQQEELRRERERREKEERKRRFEAFPEFVVREYREVTVKAPDRETSELIAAQAFSKGQNLDTYSVRRHLASSIEGNTIDRIRTVALKVARFLD